MHIRRTLRSMALLLVALIANAASSHQVQAQAAATPLKAIRFGTLVDGTGRVLRDAVVVVVVKGERVIAISTGSSAVPPRATVIDLGRYTGIPGLIDAHTHMAYY